MEVTFKNPFYHNKFGLLGGNDDRDTIYTLPDDEALPKTAVVVDGVSKWREDNPIKGAVVRKDGRFANDEGADADVVVDEDAGVEDTPGRKTPVEGAAKEEVKAPKRRKARARK